MKRNRLVRVFGALAIISLFFSAPVSASPATGPLTTTSASDTVAFMGLQWNFGVSVPEFVVGTRYTQSNSDNIAAGAKLDVAFPLTAKQWKLPTLRLMGLYGTCTVQGELGLGASLSDMKPFVAAGAQGPYVNGGANISLEAKANPYFGFNSLGAPDCATVSMTIPD
jgi:hypothetical protein